MGPKKVRRPRKLPAQPTLHDYKEEISKIVNYFECYDDLGKFSCMTAKERTDLEELHKTALETLTSSKTGIEGATKEGATKETEKNVLYNLEYQLQNCRSLENRFSRIVRPHEDFDLSLKLATRTIGNIKAFFNKLPQDRRTLYNEHRTTEVKKLADLRASAKRAGPGTPEVKKLDEATAMWTTGKKHKEYIQDMDPSLLTDQGKLALGGKRSLAMSQSQESTNESGYAIDPSLSDEHPARNEEVRRMRMTSWQPAPGEHAYTDMNHHAIQAESTALSANGQGQCTLTSEYGRYCTPGLGEPSILGTQTSITATPGPNDFEEECDASEARATAG